MIVFPAARDGDWAIYAVDQKSGAPVRIAATPDPRFGEPPVPSPDGRKLILHNFYELIVMNADGTGRKRVATGDPSSVVWSPDGKRIVYVETNDGLSVVGADGKDPRRLTSDSGDGEPAWSPDGKRLAFARSGTGVMLIDADGSDVRVLGRVHGGFEQLHWSDDGDSVTFLHRPRPDDNFFRSDLLTISADGGRVLRRVPRVNVGYERIAWSPNGRRLAYEEDLKQRMVVLEADGSGRRAIGKGRSPVWSPDGQRIVYVADEPAGGGRLSSVRPDGTGLRRLTSNYPDGVEPLAPRWLRGPVKPVPSPYRLSASRRPDGATLQTYFPVALLAASGSRVALVSPERLWAPTFTATPPLMLWDAKTGRTVRVALPRCDQPESLAVLDDRVAYDCPLPSEASLGRSIRVFPTAGTRPAEIASGIEGDSLPPGRLPGQVAGGSGLVAFSTYGESSYGKPPRDPQLWIEDGRGKELIARGPDAGEPAAVDGGRIAVERRDGQIALLRRDGRVLGRIAPGGPAPSLRFYALDRPTVGLSGHDLIVLRAGRLLVYDAGSLRLRRSLRVDRRATLAGDSDGLAAYVVGADIHVLRLRDGRSKTIRTTSRSDVQASITSAGLFYALHARALPSTELAPFHPNPATIVFVRRAAILLRLR